MTRKLYQNLLRISKRFSLFLILQFNLFSRKRIDLPDVKWQVRDSRVSAVTCLSSKCKMEELEEN